ncbi:MAG: hypothetical protein ACREEM_20820 [Blastocatellia bacterium]
MKTLALKLVLTPMLIGLASLAGCKWGAAVSGWLVGLPLTSAPITLFLALEQGPAFASSAAQGILFGLVSVAVFCLAYSWLAFRLSWLPTMLAGWLAFFVATFFLQKVSPALATTFIGVFIVLAVAFKLLPVRDDSAVAATAPRWDVPARMVIATAFVLLLTGLADVLGARLSGLLAPFPVFGTILAVFTHRFQGATAAARLLRGVVLGSFSFAAFFLVIALMIERAGILAAFICATVTALTLHGLSLLLLQKT